MLQVVLAGLGNTEVGLAIGYVTDDPADNEDRDQYQRQDYHQHLPAEFQIGHEIEPVTWHGGILKESHGKSQRFFAEMQISGGRGKYLLISSEYLVIYGYSFSPSLRKPHISASFTAGR
jgi:hypothetical protein